tara:strand:- start:188 stop:334 length:147 start_codon:yes stop_codon:yes gene_type:complete
MQCNWIRNFCKQFLQESKHVKAVDNLRRTTNATKEQLARMFNQINQYA